MASDVLPGFGKECVEVLITLGRHLRQQDPVLWRKEERQSVKRGRRDRAAKNSCTFEPGTRPVSLSLWLEVDGIDLRKRRQGQL